VDFEYVAPSEVYFHIVKTMIGMYLDGPQQDQLNLSAMSDHILERASIGSVIVSTLGDQDPERNPAYANLNDEEFDKIARKLNATREVYGFLTILSLTWSKSKLDWLNHILKYVMLKGEQNLDSNSFKSFKRILETKNVGLLVNERLINMPPTIVPALHEQIPDDLEFTKEQEDIEDPKEFNYDYLLTITKFTVPNELVKSGAPD